MKASNKLLAGVSGVLMFSAYGQAETLTGTATASATPTSFNNHLHSDLIVSPAQYYQVEGNAADFSIGYDNEAMKAGDADSDTNTYGLRATGVYSMPVRGLKLGLELTYDDAVNNIDDTTTEIETTTQTFSVAPVAVYDLGPVALAYQPTFSQSTSEVEDVDANNDQAYTTHTGAAVFKVENMEAGLAYTSEKDDGPSGVQDPSELTLHGRYMFTDMLGGGLIINNTGYSSLDAGEGFESTVNDQLSTMLTGELLVDRAMRAEAGVGFNNSYYDGSENITSSTIDTWELMAGADYVITNRASVGGALNWEFGDESQAGVDYERNTLAVAVRGNVVF